MGILTEDMRRLVRQQRLAYFATVCPDGSPNLSPKGSIISLDDARLAFLDLGSPGTLANIRANPSMEICLVDNFTRKGYRFKGKATIVNDGPVFQEILNAYAGTAVERLISTVREAVVVDVERALPLVSPGYTPGMTEEDMREGWEQYWDGVTQGYHAQPAENLG